MSNLENIISEEEFLKDPRAAMQQARDRGPVEIYSDGNHISTICIPRPRAWTPDAPSHWKVYPPGPIDPASAMYDEDLWGASWDAANGDIWSLWLDGGKGASLYQCQLVVDRDNENRGSPQWAGYSVIMRDFVHTEIEVQAWIDRAVVVCDYFINEDG